MLNVSVPPASVLYSLLRRNGEWTVGDKSLIPAVRRMAAKDGLKIVQSTNRDYMGRATITVGLVDPSNPTLLVRPDMGL